MNAIDYFSQPNDSDPVHCTIHILKAPKDFRISNTLVRLSGCSKEQLESVFHNPPKSFRILIQHRKRICYYLNRCHCFYDVSYESATGASYANAADRACASLPPLWSELAFDG